MNIIYTLIHCKDPQNDPPSWWAIFEWWDDDPGDPNAEPQRSHRFDTREAALRWAKEHQITLQEN